MFARDTEAARMRHLFGLKEADILKKVIAKKIAEQRRVVESSSCPTEVYKAQARLEAYREILYAGRKARRFLDKFKK